MKESQKLTDGNYIVEKITASGDFTVVTLKRSDKGNDVYYFGRRRSCKFLLINS